MQNALQKNSEVFDLTAFDGVQDLSQYNAIDPTGLLAHQPRNQIRVMNGTFTFELADGQSVPAPDILDVVILNISQFQYRTLFSSTYDDPNNELVCYSSNSIAPDDWSPQKKSKTCATCEYAVKVQGVGSACRHHKDIAVLTEQYRATPFFISLSTTAIIQLRNYVTDLTKQLRVAGKLKSTKDIAPLHLFRTRLSFTRRDDKGQPIPYARLQFSYSSTLAQQHWMTMQDLAKSQEIKQLIKIDDVSLASHRQVANDSVASDVNVTQEQPKQAQAASPVQAAPVENETNQEKAARIIEQQIAASQGGSDGFAI